MTVDSKLVENVIRTIDGKRLGAGIWSDRPLSDYDKTLIKLAVMFTMEFTERLPAFAEWEGDPSPENLLREINVLAHTRGVDGFIRDRLLKLHKLVRGMKIELDGAYESVNQTEDLLGDVSCYLSGDPNYDRARPGITENIKAYFDARKKRGGNSGAQGEVRLGERGQGPEESGEVR